MKKIVSIVEGAGEKEAIPVLFTRLMERTEYEGQYTFHDVFNAGGCGGIMGRQVDGSIEEWEESTKSGIERILRGYQIEHKNEGDIAGILVLRDLDDLEPYKIGVYLRNLVPRISAMGLPFPVSIAFPKCEYEAWFLASLHTISGRMINSVRGTSYPGLRSGVVFSGKPECVRDVKGWLNDHWETGRNYKESSDQKPLTSMMDLDVVSRQCRSFRRLRSALFKLIHADQENRTNVMPDLGCVHQSPEDWSHLSCDGSISLEYTLKRKLANATIETSHH